ncbi:hypothetical protein HGA34_01755 [Candidatus Falkowbacteria bacterium]|nr:hypothetical protein [Candidatus Falkowbacteria bacterium]
MNQPYKNQPVSLEAARLSTREIRVFARNPSQPLDEHLLNDTRWIELPYSSFSMQVRYDSLLERLFREKIFLRQAGINQLQHLVPSNCPEDELKNIPYFPHSRLTHAKIVAAIGLVLLGREGYSTVDQLRFAAAAAFHDAATPAGGDTVIRIDRDKFCEEANFAKVMADNQLDRRWRFFGFNLEEAQEWVSGQGRFGQLLDTLDKISYTILDVYFLIKSGHAPKTLLALVEGDTFFGDVWQDLSFKGGQLHFKDNLRLLRFLQIRAIMHDQLYKNPQCRKLELAYSRAIENLCLANAITTDNLLNEDDTWLARQLEPIDHVRMNAKIKHRHFRRQALCDAYRQRLNGRFIFTEYAKAFSTGLDWLVQQQAGPSPLADVLSPYQVDNLTRLSGHREGWHMFFYAQT